MDMEISKNEALDGGKFKKLTQSELIKKSGLTERDGQIYASAFLTLAAGTAADDLSDFGVIVNNQAENIVIALVPLNRIAELSRSGLVSYIQTGRPVYPMMDLARQQGNVNGIQAGAGLPSAYNGDGVVVGIVDGGFDYKHPNFYTANGSAYRVKRVWEQKYSGASTGSVPYGRELTTQSAILAAQTDDTQGTHGSHVAGIAAGSGYGSTFKGVAPNSDIVFVSTNGTDAGIADGFTYIFNYAQQVNKPCVINLSMGSQYGPHDGTTLLDQYCTSICNASAGRVIVGSAANSGGSNQHLSKTFTGIDDFVYSFLYFPSSVTGTTGQTGIDIWGQPSKHLQVQVAQVDMLTGTILQYTQPFASYFTETASYTIYDNDYYDPCTVNLSAEVNPQNNKPHIFVEIDNQYQDDYNVAVMIGIGPVGVTSTFHAWDISNGNCVFSSNGFIAPIIDGNSDYTVADPCGVSPAFISVGSYATRVSWMSLAGQYQSDQQTVGDISYFSSKGPTVDGRTKPDVAAPGQYLIASYNSYNPDYGSSNGYITNSTMFGGRTFYYGAMQGTSMASPFTAGVVALMLQRNRELTYQQVKQYLKSNTIKDSYTGNIGSGGSNTWGWGKVNAMQTIQAVPASATAVDVTKTDFDITIYPNPAQNEVKIQSTQLKIDEVQIADLLGKIIYHSKISTVDSEFSINISSLPAGIYYVKIFSEGQAAAMKKLVKK
jgi:subtilisin family serine protease